jgi:hypothetical protein
MVRRFLAVIAALGVLSQDAAFAQQTPTGPNKNQVPITWEELAGIIVEQNISTVLPDGVKLQGEVLAVRPEALVLDVHKSSKKKLHPLGQTEVPRASVSEVRVIRHQNAALRIVGGILGAIGGLFAVGGLTAATESFAVLIPGLLVIVPLSAVGGYYAGKLGDRRTTRLTIRPSAMLATAEEE